MTEIKIDRGGGRYQLYAKGHACGSPEACSGVSALLYALAGWLLWKPRDVETESCGIAQGIADLRFSGGTAAAAAADCVTVGLLQIARAYPDAVRVTVRDTDGENDGRTGSDCEC